jgi:hypothetical protein
VIAKVRPERRAALAPSRDIGATVLRCHNDRRWRSPKPSAARST